jgi:predicted deacylase
MAELKMLDRAAPLDRVTYVVEDTNPGSGHMQVCNPAPCTGYFHTSLKPGDRIRSGDVMGIVIPLDQTEPKPIIAEQTGIVLVLRTFPRVQQGDSVGVILDV